MNSQCANYFLFIILLNACQHLMESIYKIIMIYLQFSDFNAKRAFFKLYLQKRHSTFFNFRMSVSNTDFPLSCHICASFFFIFPTRMQIFHMQLSMQLSQTTLYAAFHMHLSFRCIRLIADVSFACIFCIYLSYIFWLPRALLPP